MNNYRNLRLSPDFTHAIRKDGVEVTFTRGESVALAMLVRNSGRVVTRGQILDALSGVGSDKNDRNVDFMINRLRRKLEDNPREPQCIGTRYGEGYFWLARATDDLPRATGAHVVIGPLRGLQHLTTLRSQALVFAQAFQAQFAGIFGAQRKVVYDPECPPLSAFPNDPPEIAVDMTFMQDGETLDVVLHATAFRSGMTYNLSRHRLIQNSAEQASHPDAIETVAQALASEIWKSLTLIAGKREPLALAMHNAAQTLQGGLPGWAESNRRLRELVARTPTDPGLKIMLAMNIHSKYVQHGLELFASGTNSVEADEREIEELVTANLPFVRDDPMLAGSAAKLLFFIGRGYRSLALEMMEGIHRTTTALAPSLIIMGMMRTFTGQLDSALAAYNQALDSTEPGSESEVYVLCLKCQTLMARDDRAELDQVLKRLYTIVPPLQFVYDIFYGPEDTPSPQAQMAMANMTIEQARGMLIFADYLCGRLFDDPQYRVNTLRIPLKLLRQRFGAEVDHVLPESVTAAIGTLAAERAPNWPGA